MGKTFAPSYANIFLYFWEESLVYKFPITIYKRYIDDIFGIFEGNEAEFLEFCKYLNTICLK